MSEIEALSTAVVPFLNIFFMPAFGFGEREKLARQYSLSPYYLVEQRFDEHSKIVPPIFYDNHSYVPRLDASRSRWLIDDLLLNRGGSAFAPEGEKICQVLPYAGDPFKPEHARNTVLVIEGPREFNRNHIHADQRPKWWRLIAGGKRDCYAVWGRDDRATLGNTGFSIDHSLELFAVRHARGVIYTEERLYDHLGEPVGFETSILRCRFTIRSSVLVVEIFRHSSSSFNSESPSELTIEGLDHAWASLIARAREGFHRTGQVVRPEVEARRKQFLEQLKKTRADSLKNGTSFASHISKIGWREALDLVEEPWQLYQVVTHHCDDRFDWEPGKPEPRSERFQYMLSHYQPSDERLCTLRQMVRNYVEPVDELWTTLSV